MGPATYRQFRELEERHWWFQGMYAMCRDELRRRIPLINGSERFGTILDVGCGTGYWANWLNEEGEVFVLDNSQDAMHLCHERGLRRLIQGSADELPIANERCDFVTALGVLEHLDKDKQFLKEMCRVLKPGGYGLLLTSAYQFLWARHDEIVRHRRRYVRTSIARMIKTAGLESVKLSYVNAILLAPIFLLRCAKRGRGPVHIEEGSPDLFMPPRALNWFLYRLLRIESLLLEWLTFPFGVGLIAVVRKPQGNLASRNL